MNVINLEYHHHHLSAVNQNYVNAKFITVSNNLTTKLDKWRNYEW